MEVDDISSGVNDYMNRLKFYMDYTYVSTPISPHEIGGDVIFGA